MREDFIKFGLSAFEVQILEECKEEKLILLENYYIKMLLGNVELYNYPGRRDDFSKEDEEPERPC